MRALFAALGMSGVMAGASAAPPAMAPLADTAVVVNGAGTTIRSTQAANWRDMALSGDWEQNKAMVYDMVSTYWPEHHGHIYVREYGLTGSRASPAAHAKDYKDFLGFVTGLYAARYHDHSQWPLEHLAPMYEQAATSDYIRRINVFAPLAVKAEMREGYMNQISYSYNHVDANGRLQEKYFHAAVVSINAAICPSCSSYAELRRATPRSCTAMHPDTALQQRMRFFNSTQHELAHALRILGNPHMRHADAAYSPHDRREENIAVVYAGLMTAKVFGDPGVWALRRDALHTPVAGQQGGPAYYHMYDATVPLAAAEKFVSHQGDRFARMNPRELLKLSVDLVAQHDPLLRLGNQERQDFIYFLEAADHGRPAQEARINQAQEASLMLEYRVPATDGKTVTRRFAYTAQMRRMDETTLLHDKLDPVLQSLQVRHNPLRPLSMAGQLDGRVDLGNPVMVAEAIAFSRDLNHPACRFAATPALP